MDQYLGKRIRSFDFENGTDGVFKTQRAIPVGKIGTIIKHGTKSVCVLYDNGETWYYPISGVEQNLVVEDPTLPRRGDTVLVWDDEDDKPIPRIFLAYIEGSIDGVICVNDTFKEQFLNGDPFRIYAWSHWKPLPQKVKLTKRQIAEHFEIDVNNLEIVD